MTCTFWRDRINCGCTDFNSAELQVDGTVNLVDSTAGTSGNISKDLIAQAVTANSNGSCGGSGVLDYLSDAGVTNVGGVLGKTYPESIPSGYYTGSVSGLVDRQPYFTPSQCCTIVMNDWAGRGNPQWGYPKLVFNFKSGNDYYFDTITVQGEIRWTTAQVRISTTDPNFSTLHPEGGYFNMTNNQIYDSVAPFLASATEKQIYDLLTNCGTGDLYSFIRSALS